jgi:hypothetical protein
MNRLRWFPVCAIRAERRDVDSGSIGKGRDKAGARRKPTQSGRDLFRRGGVEGLARRTTTRLRPISYPRRKIPPAQVIHSHPIMV